MLTCPKCKTDYVAKMGDTNRHLCGGCGHTWYPTRASGAIFTANLPKAKHTVREDGSARLLR